MKTKTGQNVSDFNSRRVAGIGNGKLMSPYNSNIAEKTRIKESKNIFMIAYEKIIYFTKLLRSVRFKTNLAESAYRNNQIRGPLLIPKKEYWKLYPTEQKEEIGFYE